MKASVVICTLNRVDLLAQSVMSVLAQTMDDYEVVVVDNGSMDATPRFGRHVAAVFPRVRFVREEQPGLSHARSRGIAEARGEIIAFLDDDAVAAPAWLEALYGALQDPVRPLGVSGRIELLWPGGRPAWVPCRLRGLFGGLDLGDERRLAGPFEHVFGANMAVRREALLEVTEFPVGTRTDVPSGVEERHPVWRTKGPSGPFLYEPEAVLYRRVQQEWASVPWIIRRAYEGGLGRAVLDGVIHGPRSRARWLAGALAACSRGLVRAKWPVFAAIARGTGRAPALTEAVVHIAFWLGVARESVRAAWSHGTAAPAPTELQGSSGKPSSVGGSGG